MAMSIGTISARPPERVSREQAVHVDAGLTARQRSFTEVLSQAGGLNERKSAAGEARQVAEDFVAMAFVQPVLKQLRESNHAAAPFAPGKGEQQFRALMDADIARKVVRASDWPLVDRLAQRLLEHNKGKAAVAASGHVSGKDAGPVNEGTLTE